MIPINTPPGTRIVCINADGPVTNINGDPKPGVSAGLVLKRTYTLAMWCPIVPDHFWIHEVSETSDGCSIVFHRARLKLAVLPRSLTQFTERMPRKIKLEA